MLRVQYVAHEGNTLQEELEGLAYQFLRHKKEEIGGDFPLCVVMKRGGRRMLLDLPVQGDE
jgi:hypothetical protein